MTQICKFFRNLTITVFYGNTNYQDAAALSVLANGPYTKHPQFNAVTLENNVGLIKLPQKLVFNGTKTLILRFFY